MTTPAAISTQVLNLIWDSPTPNLPGRLMGAARGFRATAALCADMAEQAERLVGVDPDELAALIDELLDESTHLAATAAATRN